MEAPVTREEFDALVKETREALQSAKAEIEALKKGTAPPAPAPKTKHSFKLWG